ncbi:MAG: phosphoribosylamine--glycine ligase [Candidatus Polarisedimenticolia bacterium]
MSGRENGPKEPGPRDTPAKNGAAPSASSPAAPSFAAAAAGPAVEMPPVALETPPGEPPREAPKEAAKEPPSGPAPLKLLFVSKWGLIHDLAWEVRKEGHEVRYHIGSKSDREVGDGFVDKAERWEDHKDWADVVVFDDCEFGATVEKLQKEGKTVIGGTAYTDRLEMDRDFGQEEMQAAGMTTLPRWEFSGFEDAIAFLRDNPGRYVVKPSGRAQNEKVLSFVGQEEDGLDVITMLERYKRGWGSKIKSFQLQKFVAGVEVAVGAFFNGTDYVLPVFINFEHKRMFNDEIGPQTGEMGTAGFWYGPGRLFSDTLLKMKDRLAAARYTGYVDINCIANSRGIYPLEFTCRFGYPTINLQIEGVLSKWGEFLHALARGQTFNLRTKRGFQVCVVVAVPPFPFIDPDAFRKFSEDAVVLFKKPMTDGIHPGDVRLVDGDWRLAGNSGYALIVSGSGSTMEDARREAYNRVRNIMIPNMFYRTDIGERWTREGDLLQTWGYLS